MPIIPRTPLSPSRSLSPAEMFSPDYSPTSSLSPTSGFNNDYFPISQPTLASVLHTTHSLTPRPYPKDYYEQFLDVYFESSLKVRAVLIKRIFKTVTHRAYQHLFNTLDRENAYFVMGYLRSQKSIEVYRALEKILTSPLPTRDDFFLEVMGK
jgi:hypothetical protein